MPVEWFILHEQFPQSKDIKKNAKMKPIHLSLSTPPTENHSFHTFAHLLTGFLGYQSQDNLHHGVSPLILSRNKPPEPPPAPHSSKGLVNLK